MKNIRKREGRSISHVFKSYPFHLGLSILAHVFFFAGLFFLGEKISTHLLPGEGGLQGPVYINLIVRPGGGEEAPPTPAPSPTPPKKIKNEKEVKKKETPRPAPTEETATPPKSEEANTTTGTPGTSKGSGGGGGSEMGSGPAFGEGGGSKILAEIRRRIERSKRYPPLARARQIEGIVSLSFSIETTGEVKDLQMVRSSGSSVLDEEALATVKRAAPLPYYPSPIRISLKFSLEEVD